MNTLHAIGVGIVPLLAAGRALAQTENMMNGGMGGGAMGGYGWMGGYGGFWVPILLVLVVGLVVWVVKQTGKYGPADGAQPSPVRRRDRARP